MLTEITDRVAREHQAHEAGLNRGALERIMHHVNSGPSAIRRHRTLHELTSPFISKDVLEIGSYAWPIWFDLTRGFPTGLHCINISERELLIGQQLAEKMGANKIRFHLMDAHHLRFPDESFDLVYGGAIFHHLDCRLAFSEVARVLRPGGEFIMTEPLGGNPIGKLVRLFTPQARTIDEHPLMKPDIDLLGTSLQIVRKEFFDLLEVPIAIASSAFTKRADNTMTRLADAIDRLVFRALPRSGYLARQILVAARKTG